MDDDIQIPGYRIKKLLGKGAMAKVYLAIQVALEREVALKIMAPSLITDETFCKRFIKEGRNIGQLNHPNIITIFDTGVYESHYYMALECITGGTLRERIREGLSADQILDILCQIASALGYAHRRGFIHRDVKPANILFRDYGAAVLSDFGIAKSLNDATQITAVGWTVGTPNYMSPEQAMGKPVDARSDLYSLGIVFYEMLTGSRPYHSEDSIAIVMMHVNSPIPRLPEKLAVYQPLIDKLLAKDPDDRFASAEDFIEAVDQLRYPHKKVAARKEFKHKPVPVKGKTIRRFAWLWGGLAVITLGIAIYFSPLTDLMEEFFDNGQDQEETEPDLPIDDVTQKKIDQRLKVAELHLKIGRLTEPSGSNAFYSYKQVLELDPSNTEARAGIRKIADIYETEARKSIENRQPLKNSLDLVEKGLGVLPDHEGLRRLKAELTQ